MASYEKEQAALMKLWEDLLEAESKEDNVYDDEDESEMDQLEVRVETTDTEQGLSDNEYVGGEERLEVRVGTAAPEPDYFAHEDSSSATGIPYFLGKDKKTKWNKMFPSKAVRTRAENLIKHLPGVKPVAKSLRTPLEIWKFFFQMKC